MADRSKIEWTDASWTPIRARNLKTGKVGWHCEHATTGCEFCYAEGFNQRLGTGLPFKPGHRQDVEIFLDEKMLLQPLRWKTPRTRSSSASGSASKMVFVCSMTDLFASFVTDEQIDRMFAVMALAPQHTFQILTKRPERMRAYCSNPAVVRRIYELTCDIAVEGLADVVLIAPGMDPTAAPPGRKVFLDTWPLPNVWLGVSAERQVEANERIPHLLETPAAIRFVSCEPLLGPIDLTGLGIPKIHHHPHNNISTPEGRAAWRELVKAAVAEMGGTMLDWIIAGYESGQHARGQSIEIARSLRNQCAAAGVPFFFKQWGEWIDADEWLAMIEAGPSQLLMDGKEWSPAKPLNYHDAAVLAMMCGRNRFEHQSDGTTLIRVGKHAAGNLLDGRQHLEWPAPAGDAA